MNNFISGNNLIVSGEAVISGDISQDIYKQAILGNIVSESLLCNGNIHADNLTIYNDFSIAGQLSTNSILTNNLDTQYIRLNGETVDLSTLTKLSGISGNITDFIDEKINLLIGGASSQFDTLKEIQTVLENNSNINNALVQYQNKVDKYDTDGNPKQFIYADKNNSYTGIQNFTGAVVLGLTKSDVGLTLVNNTSDLDKPVSNAVFSELNKKIDKSVYDSFITNNTNNLNSKLDNTTYNTFLSSNTTTMNNKLDKSIYDSFITSNTTNLTLKVDKSTYDTFVASHNTELTLKLDKTIYDTFLTTNISNMLLKLDKSVYDSFIASNLSNLNLKLDKSVYDTFIANNTTNLNSKLNAIDFFNIIDLKLDATTYDTFITNNTTNLNSKLDTTTYNTFLSSNTTTMNNKLDKSIYDSFIANNTTNLNSKVSAFDYLNGMDLKLDKTAFNTYQSTTNTDNIAVKSRLDVLETATTGITYSSNTDDITTIDNNLTVNKTLLVGTTNVGTSITNINNTLSGISYDANNDITYINNHVTLPGSNSLYLGNGGLYNVKSKIDEKALLVGNNSFDGTNKFQSDTVPFQLTTKNNPSSNNSLTISFATANGQINPLVKTDDLVIYTGSSLNSAKSSLFIGPWTSGAKQGIRISSSKLEVGPGIIETPSYILDASSSTGVATFKPLGLNGGLELYSTNTIDASLKTKQISIADDGVKTYGYTSFNNDNLVIANGNVISNKNIHINNSGSVIFANGVLNRWTQMYFQPSGTFEIYGNMPSSKIQFTTQDVSGNPFATIVMDSSETKSYKPIRFFDTDNTKTSTINQSVNNLEISNKVNSGIIKFNALSSAGTNINVMNINSSGCDITGDMVLSGSLSYSSKGIKKGSTSYLTGTFKNLTFPIDETLLCNLTNTISTPFALFLPLTLSNDFASASFTIQILTKSTFVELFPQSTAIKIYDGYRNAQSSILLSPDSFISISLTATSTDWYVTDYASNNVSVDYVRTNSLYLYGPININTYIAPTLSSQIGYSFNGFYNILVDSTNHSSIFSKASTSPIVIDAGTWIVNIRQDVYSPSTTTFRCACGLSTDPNTAVFLNKLASTSDTFISTTKNVDGTYRFAESFSFTHSFPSQSNVYIYYYLRWVQTVVSGSTGIYYQFTRIA